MRCAPLVSGIARTAIVGSFALMAVAFVLSLCSEADAFVAVSFVQFPLGSTQPPNVERL